MITTPSIIKSTSNKYTYHLISEEDGRDFKLHLGKNVVGRNFFLSRVKKKLKNTKKNF
jgi:hypothetical protein